MYRLTTQCTLSIEHLSPCFIISHFLTDNLTRLLQVSLDCGSNLVDIFGAFGQWECSWYLNCFKLSPQQKKCGIGTTFNLSIDTRWRVYGNRWAHHGVYPKYHKSNIAWGIFVTSRAIRSWYQKYLKYFGTWAVNFKVRETLNLSQTNLSQLLKISPAVKVFNWIPSQLLTVDGKTSG